MSYNGSFKAALPCGVRDLFLEDAAKLWKLMATWRQLLENWAYTEIIPHYQRTLRHHQTKRGGELDG